ncbi:MAG: hypothetical protein GF353_19085 [Candidatus Lokiarchaeota archaeon]|nr:hypothetical protein [Candidatus Lokiarchaeota archaeon]
MSIQEVILEPDKNPDYFDILRQYNELMDIWNKCNNEIIGFKIPKIWLVKTKKKIIKIGLKCKKLQDDFLQWNIKATNFAMEPHYFMEESKENKELVYLHFTNNLRYSINYMNNLMTLLTENYNKKFVQIDEQRNFNIAITAFLIGLVSFIVAVYSLYNQPNLEKKFDTIGAKMNLKKIESRIGILDSMANANSEKLNYIKSELDSLSKTESTISKSSRIK